MLHSSSKFSFDYKHGLMAIEHVLSNLTILQSVNCYNLSLDTEMNVQLKR